MFHKALMTGAIALMLASTLTGTSLADTDHVNNQTQDITEVDLSLGYRAISAHGAPGRAREYDRLDPSATLDLKITAAKEGKSFSLLGNVLNEDDYLLEADLNLHSQFRLLVSTESLYHNLDHVPYDPAFDPEGRQPGAYNGVPRVDFSDNAPLADYGVQVQRSEVKVRAKLPDYPAHVNLGYWRWEKDGQKQLRYVSENCAGACHMRSTSRDINRVTEEVSGSVDAHLGFFDLIFEQVFRSFRDREKTPFDPFERHNLRAAGLYQHDEDPNATFTQSTLKAHTTLGGGFVANASYAIAKRKNESNLFDVAPVDAETDMDKLASDITYAPSAHWTFNFRYRLLDLEQSNSGLVVANGTTFGFVGTPRTFPFEVRDSIDLTRAFYAASAAYRPTPRWTFKADYQREDIHRSNTDGPVAHNSLTVDPVRIDPYWELPEDEVIQKLRFSVFTRQLAKNALKANLWYEYQTSDDPAYNTSIEEGHTLFASTTYSAGALWGSSASIKLQQAHNNNHEHTQFAGATPVSFDQDREQESQNANLGVWLNPLESLSLDFNYGYLRSRIREDLLFGGEPSLTTPAVDFTIEDDDVEYRQSVHTLTLGASIRLSKALDCRLEGYHIRSEANFSPNFPTASYNYNAGAGLASADGLRGISQVDIRQNGVRGRLNWKIDEAWTAGFEVGFDDYDDLGRDAYDGSVQTYMASLSRSW